MQSKFKLSNVTKEYIFEYNKILEEMIAGMTGAELTDSISCNFIVQMIPHHRAAIQMSENILKYTTNLTLQAIAENIITSQRESIKNMEAAKNTCCELKNCPRDLNLYQNITERILHTMFGEMKGAAVVNNVNCSFMYEMIPHHLGAVRMAENALKFEICPELVPILESIIKEQKGGVAQMRELERHIGC